MPNDTNISLSQSDNQSNQTFTKNNNSKSANIQDHNRDLTDEELEGTRYQHSDQDEDDIQRAADRNTEFRGLRDTEMVDVKTQMRASDKEIAIHGVEIDPSTEHKDGVLIIDKEIDSQEMDSLDPGLDRDDTDMTREDLDERPADEGYYVDDKNIDTTPDELVNE